MATKPEQSTDRKAAARRESRRWRALEPVLQSLKLEFQKDEASRSHKVIEDSMKTLRPHMVVTAALYFGGYCGTIDCDPEEAAQDLLLVLPALFAAYGARKEFFPTLLVALRRYCCSKMRRCHVRRVVELPPGLGHKAQGPVEMVIAAEDRRQVHRAWHDLKRSGILTPKERRSLFDRYWKGETSTESSQRREMTPGAVNSQCHQGRLKLREGLKERGFRRQ